MSKKRRKQKNRGENKRRKERARATVSRVIVPYADRVATISKMSPSEFAAVINETLALPRPPASHEMASRWAKTETRLAEAKARVVSGELTVPAAVAALSDAPHPT